jgi:C4-dicarboxylate-specific signal transduction histidine kinase
MTASSSVLEDTMHLADAVIVFANANDRVRAEARLVSWQRQATLGRLAAGIAHEIDNPLGAVLANLEFAVG